MGEDEIISNIKDIYPTTRNEDFLRYLFRSYKTYFPMRLYYGRILEKLKGTVLHRDKLSIILGAVGLSIDGIADWNDVIRLLSDSRRGSLDLRGLDLSHVNMRKADLFVADLREADLRGADLRCADLRDADLRGAKTDGMDIDDAKTEGMKI
ncbi:MAG: pentapeptide repeat-containing protein [Deltaproteobacteria bacterium]|uniref:Pentapeptide repeat-containing protein n=1 Tax=Candidatus Zymogenus saltonus TaxID=2844893 RepID=A0A9D8PNH5_9DELT|nr:pentapeptide repeat-containing protein [Candidatus Zymogenus saltonus]